MQQYLQYYKIKNYTKKIVNFPISFLQNINLKDYEKIFFIGDGAGWACDNTTKSIKDIAKNLNYKCQFSNIIPKNQFLFYGSQYSILKKNALKNNIVAFDYEHGLPEYLEENKKLLSFAVANQDSIKIIRVTNSFFKNFLINSGINEKKLFQIPLTVNDIFLKKNESEIKELKSKYNIPPNKFIIGSFHKDGVGWGKGNVPKMIKGPDIFVKTLQNMKANKKDICVLLSATARGYLKKQLDEIGIEYRHINYTNFEEVPNLYNCLDLYLITSREEGGPTTMFEAMACGVPIVTTLVGHAHDHIVNGTNGFVTNIENYKELSSFCDSLFINEKLKCQIGIEGMKTAQLQTKEFHKEKWKEFFKIFFKI